MAGPLIGLVSSAHTQTRAFAARALFHLGATAESVGAIEEGGGMQPLVEMLLSDDPDAQAS